MRNLVRTIVLGLALTMFAGVSAAQEWERFAPADAGFSVSMPGKPTQNKQEVPTALGLLINHTYLVSISGGAYMVSYADFPAPVTDPARIKDMLDSARDNATKSTGGQLNEEKVISLQGHPGREWFVSLAGGLARARAYWVNQRLYQVIVLLPAGKDANAEKEREAMMTKFLDSFDLSRPRREH